MGLGPGDRFCVKCVREYEPVDEGLFGDSHVASCSSQSRSQVEDTHLSLDIECVDRLFHDEPRNNSREDAF